MLLTADAEAELVEFLRATTRARAAGEAAQTAKIQEQGDGGQTIEERIEETLNEKTGVRRIVTVKRYTAPDWRARFALLDRLDEQSVARSNQDRGPGSCARTARRALEAGTSERR